MLKKRILSLLLCVILAFSLGAFAEDEEISSEAENSGLYNEDVMTDEIKTDEDDSSEALEEVADDTEVLPSEPEDEKKKRKQEEFP